MSATHDEFKLTPFPGDEPKKYIVSLKLTDEVYEELLSFPHQLAVRFTNQNSGVRFSCILWLRYVKELY